VQRQNQTVEHRSAKRSKRRVAPHKTHESPELFVTAARSAEQHQPTAAAVPVPVIEAD